MVKMKAFKSLAALLFSFLPSIICLAILSNSAFAQREYTVVKPRDRSASESVTIRTKPGLPSKGVLAVILDPVVSGQVVVKDPAGRVVTTLEADKDGQAEVQLARNKVYSVEANFPGYLGASGKSKPLKASEVIRLKLKPQFAQLALFGLPANAQVLVDGQLKGTANKNGLVTVSELNPGDHALLVRHPEYNEYTENLTGLAAGATFNLLRIPLVRVAKLTVLGPAGATVMINGEVQGKIQNDGKVRIDYSLEQAGKRTISVELIGYQPWSEIRSLAPGEDTIEAKLNPIVTSEGVSDPFDSFIYWRNPPAWELITVGSNKRLKVKGSELGLLKDQVYRDINEDSSFLLWLDDGKGASWVVKADKEGRNYYLFHLAGPKSTSHTPNNFYTYVVRDGAAPEEVSVPVPILIKLDQTSSYEVHLEVSGERIRHWITSSDTGEKVGLGSWTDISVTKDKFLYGTFGFRSLNGETFSVDELALATKKLN